MALDFLDRGIGRKVSVATRAGDNAYSSSLLDFRGALRGSGLDAETGLNVPRTIYAQHMAVAKAVEFGEKAAGKAIPLRKMKQQFVAAMRAADEAFEDGIGEGSSIIDTGLMQGWIRGAENFIEMADNPQTAIRQLYGSERQREKLLSMMRELPEGASSGLKSDNTKRIKALVGSKPGKADYKAGFTLSTGQKVDADVELPSLFARQKSMLESERQIVGSSVTGNVNEAMANQLGTRNSVESLLVMAENAWRSPARMAARVIDNIRAPKLLRDPEASRVIGELLTTRGRDRLLAVIDEIRQRQMATGKGPKPTGGAPVPPVSPIRAGGFAGFGGKKPPEPITKDAAIAEVEAIITSRAAAAESVPIIRAATDADYQQALQIANQAINRQYGARFAKLGHETGPANKGADTYRTSLAEELARVHLREQGLDASAIADRRNRLLGTNAQNEARRSARAKAINEQPEPTADDIALWEIEDAGVDVQGFAERAAKELRLNMPASEMTTTDIVEMAERFARSYMQKGGRNVTEQEALGYEIYVAARGKPTASSGLAAGLRSDAGPAAIGGFIGFNQDGQPITADNIGSKMRNAAIGAGVGAAANRIPVRQGAARVADDVAAAGARGPKTAQQAAKFETPGSPEWEAAKAKGLDMSQAGRMARAREMGFDTETPVYRGLTRPYDAEKAGRYQMFTSSAADAGEFAGNGSVQGGNVVAAYLRRGKNLSINGGGNNFNSVPVSQLPAEVRRNLHPSIGATARTDEIAEAAQKAGFDSVSIKNVFDNRQGEIPRKPRPAAKDDVDALLAELEAGGFDMSAKGSMQIGPEIPRNYDPVTVDVIFDPSNIRSVHAAFDPDKAASPILTAGFGNIDITAPGQQIAKGLRALDRRVRSPKDPRVIGPMIGELPQRGSNAPAIEQMPRNKAASVLGDAIFIARSAEQAGGQRGALSRGIRNKVKDYSKSLTDRQAASEVVSLPARRARDNWAKAQQDYQDAWARYMALRDSRAPQADLEAAAKEVARLDALRAELKAKIPVQALPPDPKMREIVLRAVRIANRGLNKYRPLNPSRRTLEGYNEVTDLLTNPSRLADARRISQAKPLGTHERAGQVIAGAGAAGAAAYGYNALNEEERRRR